MLIDSKLVSVVIPAYNCSKYLEATVGSVLKQTYENIEVLIVNDGSTDDTSQVGMRLAELHENVTYIFQENSGVSAARNLGIKTSKGNYICFLDGDDLWPETKISAQVEFLEGRDDYDFVCGHHKEVEHDYDLADEIHTPISQELDTDNSGWIYCKQLKGMHIHIITLMFRRDYLDQVHFDTELNIAEDYDLWLRITAHHKVAHLNACLAYYRRHPTSIMTKPQKKCYKAIVLERNVAKFGLKCKSGEELTRGEFDNYLYNAWFAHGYLLFHSGKMYRQCLDAQLNALKYQKFTFAPWKYVLASMAMLALSKVK